MTFRSPSDPYRDRKKYHYADKMRGDGAASALCFKRPRKIDLRLALWTIRPEAVTCQKCRRIMNSATEKGVFT